MLTLGLDTATPITSVGLVKSGLPLVEYAYGGPRKPSEVLMPMVERALEETGVDKRDLEALAVGVGPGSFTGLRLGLGTAMALSYGLGIPVAGVGTLEAMVAPWTVAPIAPDAGATEVVGVLAGQRNLVYTYSSRTLFPRLIPWDTLLEELAAARRPLMLVGGIAWEKRDDVRARLGAEALVVEPYLAYPRGAVVARLGERALRQGQSGDPFALRPLYLRKSEAEELWQKKHGHGA